MYFSCFAKKSTKRRRHREGAELIAHLRAKSRALPGCAPKRACGRSRAPKPPFPMYPSRRAFVIALEHLNLDAVWAKSVPTFLPKG